MLQGNIRVYVRCRPMAPAPHPESGYPMCVRFTDPYTLVHTARQVTSTQGERLVDTPFTMTRVFDPKSTQEDV